MSRPLWLAAVACLSVFAPGLARAGCKEDRSAERLFAHPYGEPGQQQCSEDDARPLQLEPRGKELTLSDDLRDTRGDRPLKLMGITGMATGSALLGGGGMSLLASLFMEADSNGQKVFRGAGLGLAIGGGVLFLAGATMVGIDSLVAPAPTPDGRGAQLMVARRF